MADPMIPTDDHATHLAATFARQGRYGRHVFWVLVFGTLLAAIGLFLAWTWQAPALSRADARLAGAHAETSAAFSTPDPGPATVQRSSTP